MPTQPPPSRIPLPALARVAGGFLVAFNLLIVGLASWGLVQSRRHYLERAEITTHNLGEALEGNVAGILQRIDLVLHSVREEAEHDPKGARLQVLLQSQLQRAGLLSALLVTDPEGRTTRWVPAASRADLGDQDFFLRQQRSPEAGLLISGPFQDGPEGVWHLVLSRRVARRGGGFGGVVCAYLPLEQFTRALSTLDIGRLGSVSLRGSDLRLLARYPDFPGRARLIGSRQVDADTRAAILRDRPSVQYVGTSALDGVRRVFTLQRVEGWGLFIAVGLARSEILQVWGYLAALTTLAVLGFVSLTVGVGWHAHSAWLRHLVDQDRLAAEEAKYRMLAENAMDVVWSTDPDGNLTYVSPSITRQRGWTPEEFVAMNFGDRAVSGDSAARIRERMAAARQVPPGSQPFDRDMLEAKAWHKDGREVQVEARWRIVWGAEGRILGFQGAARDITERKRVEAERDRLIQELTQALAEVRALTGMLPICSHCKKVRDDRGYWNQIEAYISEHSAATFTHGICPDCAQVLRQEIQARREAST
jgi:PAS domain S-box-containing protein